MTDREGRTELVDALLRACGEGSEAIRQAGHAAQASTDFSQASTRDANARYVMACTSFRVSVTLAALDLRDFLAAQDLAPDALRQLPAPDRLIATMASADPATLRARLAALKSQVASTSERLRSVTDNQGADAVAKDLDTDLGELDRACGPIVQAAVASWTDHQRRVVQAQLDGFGQQGAPGAD